MSTTSTLRHTPLSWDDLRQEPFRVFFPIAVLAGLIGVALWPLMFSGWTEEYPGIRHARLMIMGFFGGFIFGFLGTSMPRLIETAPLSLPAVLLQSFLHLLAIAAYSAGPVRVGDALLVFELGLWMVLFGRKLFARQDLPPPGFITVGFGFGSIIAGLALDAYGQTNELPAEAVLLSKLLMYHCFVLLSVVGAGSFLLPRFLGLGSRQKFATSLAPTPEWSRATLTAAAAAVLIICSYGIEAAGWTGTGTLARVAVIGIYWGSTMPLERLRWTRQGVQWLLITGLACVPIGIAASGLWPGWRVALSHVELIGGFGLITFGVATRVVFGHSGHRAKLERFHPWLTTAAILMILGLFSRVSGEMQPATTVRHYIYAAACWGAGVIIWAVCVLPKVFTPDPEARPVAPRLPTPGET